MKTLEMNWTTSKGRETYGWNRVTLYDGNKKFSTCGGGYDMVGTVFADWLSENYMPRIIEKVKPDGEVGGFYGFSHINGKYYLDGGCGLDCMISIAKEIGLDVKSIWNERKKMKTHFIITEIEKKI